jgi:hypothetical protein
LIQIKGKSSVLPSFTPLEPGEPRMPTDSLFVTIGVTFAFVVFAVALAWADHQTRKTQK